ncbi:MAG: HAMP domain-containing histidine kinase [Kiritimatiellae bacterium]|nr:HAMP domain-containing histidine kinase [Kiritimatiellia bacterium]
MTRFLRIYLLAIALPALLLAVFGAFLLRADARARAAELAENRRWRAERTADDLQASARRLLDARLDRLAALPDAPARLAALRELAAADPYVRNAFLWREKEGCVWPRRTGATEEERRFLNRCEPLFSGAVPWTPPSTNAAPSDASAPSRGYRPWAAGDRHELLAWVRTAPGEICGFEFETMRFLADLAADWLESPYSQRLGLRNTWRRTARQSAPRLLGSLHDPSGTPLVPPVADPADPTPFDPSAEASLLPLFPDWHYRLSPARDASAASGWLPGDLLSGALSAPALRLAFGGVLFGLLLLSLVAGGAVLLRAARRERLDALRKTDFVSNVSHELRTPLTSIRAYAELLAADRLPDPARRRRALDTISAESARLSRLVDTLLDFSRLDRGTRPLSPRPLDLAPLAAEIADSAPSRPAYAPPPAPVMALADPDAVRQIVLNLLDNAAKYAPGAPPTLELAPLPSGGATLSVLDRGPGIPPRDARRIFDRFVRLDNSTTRTTTGYGLGLTIARRLALSMNATLTYSPRSPSGSAFTLTLPPVPPSPCAPPPSRESTHNPNP